MTEVEQAAHRMRCETLGLCMWCGVDGLDCPDFWDGVDIEWPDGMCEDCWDASIVEGDDEA